MKKILILLIVVSGFGDSFGQQTSLYTQYMFNPFMLNPAVAGTTNYFQIRSTSRFQWAGFTDAPILNSLSLFGPVSAKNMDMGYGGTVYIDATGPTSRSGIRGAFAYNVPLNDEIHLSFGAALGMMQFKIDGTQITGMKDEEPAGSDVHTVQSFYQPDGMVGVYLYRTDFQISLSADNLFNNKFDIDPQAIGISKLKRNYYLLGAYTYIFNRTWSAEASTIFKAVTPVPVQMDINARLIYQKTAWFGISFRTQEAISVLAGYIFSKRIFVGYSFDYNLTAIQQYSLGSHEIMIGYRFNSLK
jgi:type IX secretion system PorP/SprF family membrane protein